MERTNSFHSQHHGTASSSASPSSASSAAASRRNSFSLSVEKPADNTSGSASGFSSFANLASLNSSRVSLIPMPVMNTASSAIDYAKSSLKWLPSHRIELPSYAPLRSPAGAPSRLRSIFGHCLYRRAFMWILALLSSILLMLLALNNGPPALRFRKDAGLYDSSSPEFIWLAYPRLDGYFNGVRAIVPVSKYHAEYPTADDTEAAHLQELAEAANKTAAAQAATGFLGKRAEPEVPSTVVKDAPAAQNAPAAPDASSPSATPTPYNAQPDYNSTEYRAKHYPVRRCFLDAANTIPAPSLWAYAGVPQGQPMPLMGSHSLLGMNEDVCFDRFGRYGPYGLGYSTEEGGTGLALDTEREGSEQIWSEKHTTGKIDYTNVDWAEAQRRCFESNQERFGLADSQSTRPQELAPNANLLGMSKTEKRDESVDKTVDNSLKKIERTAIVMRCYAGFKWTPHSILNMRALVNELSLQSGGEYDIHILLHARDENIPVWADKETAEQFIADNVPREFRGLTSLWAEGQMRLLYPGMRDQPVFENPSNNDIHGVYRSPHLALQHFAQQHPEYDYYWNWEMDMRFLGSYYEFFNRLGSWADKQPRRRLWDRSSKYYFPALHGSWENFTARVDAEAHEAGRPSILGELMFAGRAQTRDEERGVSPLPSGCEGAVLSTYNRTTPADNSTLGLPGRHFFADRNNNYTDIPEQCGVGEGADLITLNPMFDSDDSAWVFQNDVTGYDLAFAIPPRRTAIITASRLSRRLLFAMHEETWRLRHGMFAEMFPPSIALHRGFKAVYAPHPVYADRHWPLVAAEKAFNSGPDHSSGAGPASPFNPLNEHYHRGMSWYYNANFAGRLWRRWLGYIQPMDDPVALKAANETNGANGTNDTFAGLAGGAGAELLQSGRMCMRSVLVHPIKFESLDEIFG